MLHLKDVIINVLTVIGKINIMNKQFVTKSIAEKLKEKGFSHDCIAYYNNTNDSLVIRAISSLNKANVILAPTWTQLDEWLLERKVLIETIPVDSWKGNWYWRVSIEDYLAPFCLVKDYDYKNPYGSKIKAYESAVEYALTDVL